MTRPGGRDARVSYFVDLMARLIQAVMSTCVAAVFRAQLALALRAGQRAEYLADHLAGRIAELPEPERERRRRLAARERLRVDESHPPTHLRIAAELAADHDRIARELRGSAYAALWR